MVHLSHWIRLLILFDLALGIISSIFGPSYLLLSLSLILLFSILIFNPCFRYHETIYLFVYSTIICFPFNLRLSINYAIILLDSAVYSMQAVSLGIVAATVLVSIEEIILCLIGYLIWGEQDDLYKNF